VRPIPPSVVVVTNYSVGFKPWSGLGVQLSLILIQETREQWYRSLERGYTSLGGWRGGNQGSWVLRNTMGGFSRKNTFLIFLILILVSHVLAQVRKIIIWEHFVLFLLSSWFYFFTKFLFNLIFFILFCEQPYHSFYQVQKIWVILYSIMYMILECTCARILMVKVSIINWKLNILLPCTWIFWNSTYCTVHLYSEINCAVYMNILKPTAQYT